MSITLTKELTVAVNIPIARKMLLIAGYMDESKEMTDDEIFNLALSMNDCYGVTYKEKCILQKCSECKKCYEKKGDEMRARHSITEIL